MIFNQTGGGSGGGWTDVTNEFTAHDSNFNGIALTNGTFVYLSGEIQSSYMDIPLQYLPYANSTAMGQYCDAAEGVVGASIIYGDAAIMMELGNGGAGQAQYGYFTILYPIAQN